MKIGVITYHRSHNYGAQLQAYALTKALNIMGHKAEVLDCNSIGESKIFYWNFRNLRGFLGALRNNLLSCLTEFSRNRKFRDFSKNMIPRSSRCFEHTDLNEVAKNYDFIITGSDQVWHPGICNGNTIFFLDLPIDNSKKIAYAPSFGVNELSVAELDKYMPLIDNINHLSIREQSGANLIKRHIGRDVPIVTDPTFLLTKHDWLELAKPPEYSNYLFYFTILDEPFGSDEFVKDLARAKNLTVVRIGTVKDILKRDFKSARVSGPTDFLSLINNADFIVTSSFHGVVFSLIFHKQFFCVLNNNERNSRLVDLLTKLNLENRIIRNLNADPALLNQDPIDYNDIDNRLNAWKKQSLDFLESSLSPLD